MWNGIIDFASNEKNIAEGMSYLFWGGLIKRLWFPFGHALSVFLGSFIPGYAGCQVMMESYGEAHVVRNQSLPIVMWIRLEDLHTHTHTYTHTHTSSLQMKYTHIEPSDETSGQSNNLIRTSWENLSQLSHDQIATYTNSDISSIWFKNKKKAGWGGGGGSTNLQDLCSWAPCGARFYLRLYPWLGLFPFPSSLTAFLWEQSPCKSQVLLLGNQGKIAAEPP